MDETNRDSPEKAIVKGQFHPDHVLTPAVLL